MLAITAANSGQLYIEDGITLHAQNGSGTGSIVLSGPDSTLGFLGTQPETLNMATVTFGAGGAIASDTSLTLGSALVLQQVNSATFEGQGGSITNDTTIAASGAGDTLTLSVGSFINADTLSLSGGEQALFSGNFLKNTGTLSVGAGSTLTLQGAGSPPHETVPSFTNDGTLLLHGGTLSGPPVAGEGAPTLSNQAGGHISGQGTVAMAIDNSGTIEASNGNLDLQQLVSGTGVLRADANSTLVLRGGLAAGSVADFAGTNATIGLSPISFLGSLAGFAPGEQIDLIDTAVNSASFVGDSILVSLTSGQTFTLQTTTAETGALSVTSDENGGTIIFFTGHSHS